MKLIFLGSGSAFTVGTDNYQSNMLLTQDNGRNLLIDCGTDARHSLEKLGFSYQDISDVYISHLHADHAGGLEWLGFTTRFDPQCTKPNLYISKQLVGDLWNNVLAGGMSSIQGQWVDLSYYFNVSSVDKDPQFFWQNYHFNLIQTVHIARGFSIMPSFGLFFTINGIKIFITTDTQFCPSLMMEYYYQADFIFHDCETKAERSLVHANYQELKTLDNSIKTKMWLYHYNPGELPDVVSDGFLGFVKRGQVFDFADKESFFKSSIFNK